VSGLYGNGIMMTERVLDYLWGRQNVTLNNIVNINTPGFKAQYVTFEEELAHRIRNAAKRPNPRNGIAHAISQTRVGVNTTWAESIRLDGNSVDMDQEQVELVRTAYEYQYMLSSINSDINRLKSAAKVF